MNSPANYQKLSKQNADRQSYGENNQVCNLFCTTVQYAAIWQISTILPTPLTAA